MKKLLFVIVALEACFTVNAFSGCPQGAAPFEMELYQFVPLASQISPAQLLETADPTELTESSALEFIKKNPMIRGKSTIGEKEKENLSSEKQIGSMSLCKYESGKTYLGPSSWVREEKQKTGKKKCSRKISYESLMDESPFFYPLSLDDPDLSLLPARQFRAVPDNFMEEEERLILTKEVETGYRTVCEYTSDGKTYFAFADKDKQKSELPKKTKEEEMFGYLGIAPTKDIGEIKRAYRKKSLTEHPDKGGSKERFQKLGEAYDFLKETMQFS